MKVLLAGPGTGKTTRVRSIVETDYGDSERILVLSFTNATVQDLTASFSDYRGVECHTLHGYALRINHLRDHYILDGKHETPAIQKLAGALDVDFLFLCDQFKCISFEAMIADCLRFLRDNPVYAKEQIGELDLLIVDEYQDLNATERSLVEAISAYAADTIILGDDDQSIYGFKDADPDQIIALYGDDGIEKLAHDHICHRCPDPILERAARLISHNKHRVDKPWHPSGREGDFVHRQFLTQQQTNEFIALEIERLREQDPDATFLVLSSVRFYAEQLADILADRGLDYVDFWDPPTDLETCNRVWWLRAIYSKRKLLNLLFLSGSLTPHYRRKLMNLLGTALRQGLNQDELVSSIAGFYARPFSDYLTAPPELEAFAASHDDFAELVEGLDRDHLERSLQGLMLELKPRQEFQNGSVNIMSIHKSKGLQGDVVFINSLVEGVLPNETTGLDTIEAQRRLLFVGLTRASRALYLLSPVEWEGKYVHRLDKGQFNYNWPTKAWRGQTSRFVNEML